MFRAEEYAKLISTHPGSSTDRVFRSLHDNLTHLFAEILNFLIRATLFFEKSTLSKVWIFGLINKNLIFLRPFCHCWDITIQYQISKDFETS